MNELIHELNILNAIDLLQASSGSCFRTIKLLNMSVNNHSKFLKGVAVSKVS